jgi:hypothetical protein
MSFIWARPQHIIARGTALNGVYYEAAGLYLAFGKLGIMFCLFDFED